MADRYSIFSGSFTHAGGTMNLQQLDSQGLSAGSRKKTIRPGGATNPAAHILSTANPRCQFRTCDLLTLHTVMGSNFFLYCSGGHVMRYQKRIEGGAFAAGLDHFVQSTAKGFLYITEIGVDIDSDEGAYANLEYIPLSVAGENPIANTPAQSFAAVAAPAFMSQYFMGGLWLATTPVLGLTRFAFRPGTQVVSRRSDGGVFSRADGTSIVARDPMFDLTFLNAEFAYDIGTMFLTALGATINGYLQRGTTAVDGRIAGASLSHIRYAAAAGSWGVDNLSVSGIDDATTQVMIAPVGSVVPTLGVALGA
jgi:hypothetical protein